MGGVLWAFHDVEPGATAKAEKIGKPLGLPSDIKYPFHDEGTAYGRNWEGNLAFAADARQKMAPGAYVVEVEGSPFFPNPLQRKKSSMSAAGLVFGKFKEVAE